MKKIYLLAALVLWAGFASAQSFGFINKIISSDRDSSDSFSTDVSIDGDYAVAGAWRDKEDTAGNNPLSFSGSIYVYKRNGAGQWTFMQKLTAPDRVSGQRFGLNVCISGNYIVAGAANEGRGCFRTEPASGGRGSISL